MIKLLPEWLEFLRVLKRHGVRFLIVGGHAVAVHGRPRATEDIDLLVEPTDANARRVSAAIVEFGFRKTGRDWKWFAKPYRITTMGRVPNRIDVLTSISGVDFRVAWKRRTSMRTELGTLPVIGLADLRANKLAAGRPKDLFDIALLDEVAVARRRVGSQRRSKRRVRSTAKRKAGAPRPSRRK